MSNLQNLPLLEDLKAVSLDNLTKLPEKIGICLMANKSGYVYYVSKSTNLKQYLLNYDLSNLYQNNIYKIHYLLCNQTELEDIEAEYLIFYTPFRNQDKNQIDTEKIPNSISLSFYQKIDRYLEICNLIDKLEKEKEILKKDITNHADDYKQKNGTNLTYKNITILTNQRKTWEYSSVVKELETKIKNLKKVEQKNGLAKVVKLSLYSTIRGK